MVSDCVSQDLLHVEWELAQNCSHLEVCIEGEIQIVTAQQR